MVGTAHPTYFEFWHSFALDLGKIRKPEGWAAMEAGDGEGAQP
jgi:hypothetical protein